MSKDNEDIAAEDRTYHYGNLREVLVVAGLEALKKKDSDDFSLREVARNVGVSATSVYRHFSGKQAFVEALCAEGSKMLASALRKAMTSKEDAQEGLDASGLAYVHFALENPALFGLMRQANLGYGDPSSPAMQELLSNVATLLPNNATPRQLEIRALQAWSVVHGAAMLVLEGGLKNDNELIMEIIRTPRF